MATKSWKSEIKISSRLERVPQGQLEVLRRLLPSYHYLQKSKAAA
ncbi:hypothetical protein ANCDUO_13772 [Ancylostoma duodenale]|uniref:Uncharacterized protein n=1 Tax=Ancylostoma duodenale TaxID=51022 RepID=A0A0C2G4Z0_9BILA|nr:hypothetical protein ANCDUO_13772 [Ancylostoma duodenale]